MTTPLREVRHVSRFSRTDRLMHGFLMFSFLGLALTGLPLLFSHAPWAARLSRLLGGAPFASLLHRFFALVLIGVFVTHVARLVRRVIVHNDYTIFWGPSSMVPQPTYPMPLRMPPTIW